MWLQRMREECDEWECALPRAGGWRQGGLELPSSSAPQEDEEGGTSWGPGSLSAAVTSRQQLPGSLLRGKQFNSFMIHFIRVYLASQKHANKSQEVIYRAQTDLKRFCVSVVSSFWALLDIHVRIGCQNTWSSTTDISWSVSLMQQTVDGVCMGEGVGLRRGSFTGVGQIQLMKYNRPTRALE